MTKNEIKKKHYRRYKKEVGLCSKKDSTWVKDKINGGVSDGGFHSCCNSKRAYYHKVSCDFRAIPDDLSDLK